MAASDAHLFPVKNAANQLSGWIVSYTTANPITGGLTGLAATISKDGGAFASTTNAPTEIGTTGGFTLNLTSTECNCSTALVTVTATNSGAVYARFWLVFSTVDVVNAYANLAKILLNKQAKSGNLIFTYESDGTTVAFTQQFSVEGTEQTGTFTRSAIY